MSPIYFMQSRLMRSQRRHVSAGMALLPDVRRATAVSVLPPIPSRHALSAPLRPRTASTYTGAHRASSLGNVTPDAHDAAVTVVTAWRAVSARATSVDPTLRLPVRSNHNGWSRSGARMRDALIGLAIGGLVMSCTRPPLAVCIPYFKGVAPIELPRILHPCDPVVD